MPKTTLWTRDAHTPRRGSTPRSCFSLSKKRKTERETSKASWPSGAPSCPVPLISNCAVQLQSPESNTFPGDRDAKTVLGALAKLDLQAPAVRAAAGRGTLLAVRNASGRWRSTRVWVEEYKATRYRRDPE